MDLKLSLIAGDDELFPGADEGLCRGFPPGVFYPTGEAEYGRRISGPAVYARALSICRMCPVQDPCAAYAVARPEPYGVWGGLTPADRRRIRGTHGRHPGGEAPP